MAKTTRQKIREAKARRKYARQHSEPEHPFTSAQIRGQQDKPEEQPQTKSTDEQPKGKKGRSRGPYMEFFFESIYQILTWVGLALAIMFLGIFYGQHNWRGVLWSGCSLACLTIIMVCLIAQRHFPIFGEHSDVSEQEQKHWRLTTEQRKRLVESLEAIPDRAVVKIVCTVSDAESYAFANDLDKAVRSAGWQTDAVYPAIIVPPFFGVNIKVLRNTEPSRAAKAFAHAFEDAGIHAPLGDTDNMPADHVEIQVGSRP